MVRKTRKIKDKWKEKRWITVLAPESFGYQSIGYIPITDEKNAIGRVLELTRAELTKSTNQEDYSYKLYFQINKVTEEKATTIFKRFEYSKEFLRSLIRRGSSRINFTIDVKTKDGYMFRMKILVLSHRELNTSRKHALRLEAKKQIEKEVPKMEIDKFAQSVCWDSISAGIMAATKKIIRVRHVGLEKVKLLRTSEEAVALLQA